LAPLNAPPSGQRSRGRIICNCLDVAENEIREDVAAGADFTTLQNKRKCGTQCGSCVPEIKRLVQDLRGVETLVPV
jgi:assimilatory nitrate reductase catalytic subunit